MARHCTATVIRAKRFTHWCRGSVDGLLHNSSNHFPALPNSILHVKPRSSLKNNNLTRYLIEFPYSQKSISGVPYHAMKSHGSGEPYIILNLAIDSKLNAVKNKIYYPV